MTVRGAVVAVVSVILGLAQQSRAENFPEFRIYTADPGVVRLQFEELAKSGLGADGLPSAALALSNNGRRVPLWVDDGGDGTFAAGDAIEFVAEAPRGKGSYYHEYSLFNVYWLTCDREAAARMTDRSAMDVPAIATVQATLDRHVEWDGLMVRLPLANPAADVQDELWYWHKLTHLDTEPFRIELDLDDLDPGASGEIRLAAGFRAVSARPLTAPTYGTTDHEVDLSLDGELLGAATWNGREKHEVELTPLPAATTGPGPRQLGFRVPYRPTPNGDPIVDVVMLNYVEYSFPHSGRVRDSQLTLHAPARDGVFRLEAPDARRLVAYGSDGSRAEIALRAGSGALVVAADQSYTLVPDGAYYHAARIERDRPSDLRNAGPSDYLMIAHSSLLAATERLATFHRSRGLRVRVVDVQDVYDEFTHGMVDPTAIRRFIAQAYRAGGSEPPRFVLIVGDASWDTKNSTADDANYANWASQQLVAGERFARKKVESYDDEVSNRRGLVPTWNYGSREGHAASDNYFVSVDGDDDWPDLAIGRLPVVEPREVDDIVAKIERYVNATSVGPWRRRITWISDGDPRFDGRTDRIAAAVTARGFEPIRILPQADGADLELHRERLLTALGSGQLIVHFMGHGGRFVWRTGPADFSESRDLFDLDDLDRLKPSAELPIVLSMTCFSAPFDHPSADSIGERFLRLADRGAVAVIAASWRVSPNEPISNLLLDELTRPGTVGEALQRAKRRTRQPQFLQLFNLLGDPALPVDAPQLQVDLTLESLSPLRLEARLAAPAFNGRAVVDWIDAQGAVLRQEELQVDGPRFSLSFGAVESAELPVGVLVYAWDEASQIDGLGGLQLTQTPVQSPGSERSSS